MAPQDPPTSAKRKENAPAAAKCCGAGPARLTRRDEPVPATKTLASGLVSDGATGFPGHPPPLPAASNDLLGDLPESSMDNAHESYDAARRTLPCKPPLGSSMPRRERELARGSKRPRSPVLDDAAWPLLALVAPPSSPACRCHWDAADIGKAATAAAAAAAG